MPTQSELPAPPAKFFWFLPTNGDSRSIVGASHASSHHTVPANYRAPSRRYLAEVARAADRLGYEGVLTPTGTWCEDAWLTASALLRRDRAAEVPRRIPARAGAADAGRAADRDAAAVLRGPGAAQHRQRRRRPRAAPVRRLAQPRRALRPHGGVPAHRELGVAPGLPRLRGQYYTVADARVSAPPDPLPQIYFGGSSAAALPIAARVCRRLSDLGRASAGGGRQDREGAQARRRAWPQRAFRHPVAHHQPRHLGGGVGGRRRAARPNSRRTRSPKPLSCTPSRSPKGSGG